MAENPQAVPLTPRMAEQEPAPINWKEVVAEVQRGGVNEKAIWGKLSEIEKGEYLKALHPDTMRGVDNPDRIDGNIIGWGGGGQGGAPGHLPEGGLSPEMLLGGGLGAGKIASKAIDGIASRVPSIGGVLKTGAGASVGGEIGHYGARMLADLLHLPTPLKTLLGMGGGILGGGMGGVMATRGAGGAAGAIEEGLTEASLARAKAAPGGTSVAPMSDAEYLAQTGHPRGQFGNPAPPAGGMAPGLFERNAVGGKTGVAESAGGSMPNLRATPSNISNERSVGEAAYNMRQGGARVEGITPEPPTMGLRPGAGSVQLKPPMSEKGAKISDSSEGSLKLEELLDRMYGKNRKTQGNGTYKEPDPTNFRKEEFPPGTSNKSTPREWQEKSNASANGQEDKVATATARDKIKATLRKPK